MKSVILTKLPKECPICGEDRATVAISKNSCSIGFECNLKLINTKTDEPEFKIAYDCKNATQITLEKVLPQIDNGSITERTKAAKQLNKDAAKELEEFKI